MTINTTELMGLEFPDYDEPVREFPKRMFRIAAAVDRQVGGAWTAWQPAVYWGGGDSYPSTANLARYKVIGNRCYVNAWVTMTVATPNSGKPYIKMPQPFPSSYFTNGNVTPVGLVFGCHMSAGAVTSSVTEMAIALPHDGQPVPQLYVVNAPALSPAAYAVGDVIGLHLAYDWQD